MTKLSLIVPCYNEEENVPLFYKECFEAFSNQKLDVELIFINDGSEDSTLKELNKLIKNRENKFTHNTQKDIHESDKNHLMDAYYAACEVAKDYHWYEVQCVKDDKIRTIEDIHTEIYQEVKKQIQVKMREKIR